jgi:hypothetical protein
MYSTAFAGKTETKYTPNTHSRYIYIHIYIHIYSDCFSVCACVSARKFA